ncbi:hypothetical protein [Winogradskyella wichelsiae]|uniref:hypothetical protein n=1 Tax=Winogradskyella wichelsiae TaxID=2697007 RepID=UPI003EF56C04
MSKQIYFYNNQNQEIESKRYRNNEHLYSYVTSYSRKGQVYRYEMIDEIDGGSRIWLYEYDKKGQVAFKIDLYARTSDKISK